MKQWWSNLALREKQSLGLGGTIIILFIIYAWIWSPLSTKITTLRTQVAQSQKLLAWMQVADKQLNQTEPRIYTTHSAESLLSMTQKEINQSNLAKQLSQLRQADNDAVQLSFKKVDFDHLIAWLTHSSHQQGLGIAQFTIAPSETPGIVSAELQLKSS